MTTELQPNQRSYYFRGDWQIWLIVLILMAISVVEVYSTTLVLAYKSADDDTFAPLLLHLLYLMGGGLTMFFFHMIPVGKLANFLKPVLVIMAGVLLFTFFFGVEINGARRWVRVAGITFQPSELIKIPLILYIAHTLAEKRKQLASFSFVAVNLFGVVSAICALILVSNLSTALFLGGICLILMFLGRVSVRYLLGFVFTTVLTLSLFIYINPDIPKVQSRVTTWRHRIENFVAGKEDDSRSSQDAKFQVESAKRAIANGMLWGKGPGNGTESMKLPLSYGDYIFAAMVEEGGVLIAVVVMALYIWLLYRIYLIMVASRRPYHLYLCAGIALMIVLQAFLHMCICVGWLPVTGLTLPLMSQGGSSILAICVALGMIQSVAREQRKELYEGETQNAI